MLGPLIFILTFASIVSLPLLLNYFLNKCTHNYEKIKEINKYQNAQSIRPYQTIIVQQCIKCSKIRKVSL